MIAEGWPGSHRMVGGYRVPRAVWGPVDGPLSASLGAAGGLPAAFCTSAMGAEVTGRVSCGLSLNLASTSLCMQFTSKEFKSQAINVLRLIQTGQMVDPDTEEPPPPFDVDWSNEDCTKAKKAKEAMCPHPTNWWYTVRAAGEWVR